MLRNIISTSMLVAAVLLLMTACKKEQRPETPVLKGTQVTVEIDTTIYGTCYGAAMHTFTLLTANGDSVSFTRESVDEVGDVQGGLFDGDKLAVVGVKDGDDMFAKKVINLTSLLGKWTSLDRNFEIKDGGQVVSQGSMAESKPYTEWKIMNGQLILSADTFDVVNLGPDSLYLENSVGIFVYKRQQ